MEIILDALLYKGYDRKQSEHIIAQFLEEEAKDFVDSKKEDAVLPDQKYTA